ncbi:hypothetical protein VE04_00365 [Pseudogymnoascus sp. 24MN13]|nr:hypothetical protein VE04_00365 [Pseudogymnoascus sp. 24MN13]
MLSILQENHGATAGQLALVASVFLTISLLSSCVISYFRSGLRELPGPVLARFTLLWKVWVHIKGDAHVVYQNIHKRYGPIVRTGPNNVSIGDASMIPEIHLSGHSYRKSSDLAPFTFMIDGRSVESYAREVFGSQPDRRFVPGFTICGSVMRLWVFDRSGPYSSEKFDIHKEPERFVWVITGYALMTDAELGLNTFIRRHGNKYIVAQGLRICLVDKPLALAKGDRL